MASDYYINGETLVTIDGSIFALSDSPIRVVPTWRYQAINVDTFGPFIPPEKQYFLAQVNIRFNAVFFDNTLLQYAIAKSMGGAPAPGTMVRAGTRMGGGNNLFVLRLTSPLLGIPWRFLSCHLAEQPFEIPLGTERSLVSLNFEAFPYTADPSTAVGVILWDHN